MRSPIDEFEIDVGADDIFVGGGTYGGDRVKCNYLRTFQERIFYDDSISA